MKMPDALLAKTLARFDSLIAEGRNILDSAETVPPTTGYNELNEERYEISPGYKKIDSEKFIEWRIKSVTLLARVVSKGQIHRAGVEDIRNLAAHGEFAQFKRTDVEGMISGIDSFLADYLK